MNRMSIPDEARSAAAKLFGEPTKDVIWVITGCPICSANVYTVNMEVHLKWHKVQGHAERWN